MHVKSKILEINGGRGTSVILVGESFPVKSEYLPEKNVFIITDENVYRLYSDDFPEFPVIKVKAGERFKDLKSVELIFEELLKLGADRSSFILGIGGGVVCDIAGFVASTYMRGVRFGFVSTTLLSQVDASVGGKNGVNLGGTKNIIGVFNQPEFVLCFDSVLSTLPKRELVSGFSEVIKYALIRDVLLFEEIEGNLDSLLSLEPGFIQNIIWTSINMKKEIVELDELEGGIRRILNFGHTFGHAIEKTHGLTHGESIAYGMLIAVYISEKEGLLSSEAAVRINSFIKSTGLIVDIKLDENQIISALQSDKKRDGDGVHFILLSRIGNAVEWNTNFRILENYFKDWLNTNG